MKLSKAQTEVMEQAKARIDFARTHDFYDWYRNNSAWYENKSNEEIDAMLKEQDKTAHKIGGTEYELTNYEKNRNGIDYLCHASSKTIIKLEELGLIEIIKDSNGEHYGFDEIRVLNY